VGYILEAERRFPSQQIAVLIPELCSVAGITTFCITRAGIGIKSVAASERQSTHYGDQCPLVLGILKDRSWSIVLHEKLVFQFVETAPFGSIASKARSSSAEK
jgi:hypothetical protein